jgi:hypothetical protein
LKKIDPEIKDPEYYFNIGEFFIKIKQNYLFLN